MARYLVVAHQTAGSEELLTRLKEIAHSDANAEFVLLVPATPVDHLLAWEEGETAAIAISRAAVTAEQYRASGLKVIAHRVGDQSPLLAIEDELRDHSGYDTIVISTLAPAISRWVAVHLVDRVHARTGLAVVHVIAEPAKATALH
jgi:hypothetical protein